MAKIKKYANGIERFLRGEKGQRFFNIAFSLGAAVVIWGALFKILHLPYGSLLLSIGMGTEVVMFILMAFDRPPKEVDWEEVIPALSAGGSATPQLQDTTTSGHHNPTTPQHHNTAAPQSLGADMSALTEGSEACGHELEALQRNLTALNSLYEIQIREMSRRFDSMAGTSRSMDEIRDIYNKTAVDAARICEESQRMTRNMNELNAVYEKMLAAMAAAQGVVSKNNN